MQYSAYLFMLHATRTLLVVAKSSHISCGFRILNTAVVIVVYCLVFFSSVCFFVLFGSHRRCLLLVGSLEVECHNDIG